MSSTLLRPSTWLVLAALLGAPASAQTIEASSRGWFNQNGLHTAGNLNTFVGQGAGTDRFRSFFVFDLATLSRPAESGVLRLELEAYFGPDPMELVSLYDVGTHPDDLVAGQTSRSDIYADLGGDVAYGAAFAQATNVGAVLEIPLTPQAIADINLAAGGRFAVGVSADSLRLPRGSEGVRFSLAGESRVHQLVLSAAPVSLSISIEPALAAVLPSAEHTLTALVVDSAGAPMPGAPVAFSVVTGPNAGVVQSVAADPSGAATFSYSGSAMGVDRILAELADGSANAPQTEALAFWDADCNTNAIPDTCDLSCDGFDAACASFPGCGGSPDANGSGAPDECDVASNAPPDCSQASVTPGMLLRPDHRFREVAIHGVSDPDGDPVQLVVDAVFQDEPVEMGLRGAAADALGVGGELVKLRAQSRARGDGRVYHLAFSANDGRGGDCSGEVVVCVPHIARHQSDSCVDQGPLYDSTVSGQRPSGRGWWWWRHRHHRARH